MRFINEIREGDQVNGVFFCKQKNSQKTKTGKSYYSLTLQDKTGVLDGKVWDLNNGIENFDSLDYIHIVGTVTAFQSSLQLNISRIRVADPGEYVVSDYMPTSTRDIKEMRNDISTLIASVKETHLNALLRKIFVEDVEFAKTFMYHSAAKSMHHGFVGGLMEHTVAVANLCDDLAKRYPILNRDLLVSAALLHDIGKVRELSAFPSNDYTDDGQLLGHIYIGAAKVEAVGKTIPGFPPVLLSELVHCILAHHGKLEYGSPKKPSLAEAMALNFADDCDAKMEALKEMMGEEVDGYVYSKMFENSFRKTEGAK